MGKQQQFEFSQNTIDQINFYRQAPGAESYTSGAQVKLTPTQLAAVKHICKEHNLNASTLIREALDFYIDLYPYREKIRRHHRMLRELCKNLA